ncbi:MAG: hypothetical protein WC648_04745 [Candidatus Paceibacterota bacterium]
MTTKSEKELLDGVQKAIFGMRPMLLKEIQEKKRDFEIVNIGKPSTIILWKNLESLFDDKPNNILGLNVIWTSIPGKIEVV